MCKTSIEASFMSGVLGFRDDLFVCMSKTMPDQEKFKSCLGDILNILRNVEEEREIYSEVYILYDNLDLSVEIIQQKSDIANEICRRVFSLLPPCILSKMDFSHCQGCAVDMHKTLVLTWREFNSVFCEKENKIIQQCIKLLDCDQDFKDCAKAHNVLTKCIELVNMFLIGKCAIDHSVKKVILDPSGLGKRSLSSYLNDRDEYLFLDFNRQFNSEKLIPVEYPAETISLIERQEHHIHLRKHLRSFYYRGCVFCRKEMKQS